MEPTKANLKTWLDHNNWFTLHIDDVSVLAVSPQGNLIRFKISLGKDHVYNAKQFVEIAGSIETSTHERV